MTGNAFFDGGLACQAVRVEVFGGKDVACDALDESDLWGAFELDAEVAATGRTLCEIEVLDDDLTIAQVLPQNQWHQGA